MRLADQTCTSPAPTMQPSLLRRRRFAIRATRFSSRKDIPNCSSTRSACSAGAPISWLHSSSGCGLSMPPLLVVSRASRHLRTLEQRSRAATRWTHAASQRQRSSVGDYQAAAARSQIRQRTARLAWRSARRRLTPTCFISRRTRRTFGAKAEAMLRDVGTAEGYCKGTAQDRLSDVAVLDRSDLADSCHSFTASMRGRRDAHGSQPHRASFQQTQSVAVQSC